LNSRYSWKERVFTLNSKNLPASVSLDPFLRKRDSEPDTTNLRFLRYRS